MGMGKATAMSPLYEENKDIWVQSEGNKTF